VGFHAIVQGFHPWLWNSALSGLRMDFLPVLMRLPSDFEGCTSSQMRP
jgi:hypothetical protein